MFVSHSSKNMYSYCIIKKCFIVFFVKLMPESHLLFIVINTLIFAFFGFFMLIEM